MALGLGLHILMEVFSVFLLTSIIIQTILRIYSVARSGLSAMKMETNLSQRACYLGRETQLEIMGD